MSQNSPVRSVVEHFSSLPEPRMERARLHELSDIIVIIVITVCGAICVVDNWVELERFANAKIRWDFGNAKIRWDFGNAKIRWDSAGLITDTIARPRSGLVH